METIKSVLGLGTAPQEGREPVSGVSGSGVGGEPYDQGNVEDSTLGGKAPQHTDTITDGTNHGPYTIGTGLGSNSTATTDNTSSGITSSGGVTPNAASATSASGPAVDPTSSNTNVGTSNVSATSTSTTSGPHSSDGANKVDPRVDSDKSKTDSTGPIGSSSWMSTALPHREGDNKTSDTGVSDSAITGTSSSAATSSIPSSSTNTTTDVSDKTVGVPSTTEPSHSLTGSRASIAPTKPTEKTGSSNVNPDAIPLAGGKKIGEDAYTERKSMQVDSIDADLPATTSSNTARNVGTAEATGRPSATLSEHEKSSVISDKEKSSVASGGSGSEHKEKKGLVEKIKEKVHIHKHDK